MRNYSAKIVAAFCVLAGLLGVAGAAQGQDWAAKMFNTRAHDFGTVARGAKAIYRFQVKNLYEEEAHIAAVRSSCGCTTPQIVKPDLKTFEVGEIVAELNTVAFIGQKHATITVTFDKPFFAEVQLEVSALIRSDVVVTPGDVEFGTVDQGAGAEKKITVVYAGRNDWQITDVKTADPHFAVEMNETSRGGGRVSYDLLVRLTKDAPAGYVKDQLILVTNDARAPELFVDIDGRVTSTITVNPAPLFMGVVHPGQTVKKQLFVRGKKPFKIVDVKCDDKSFSITPGGDAKTVHMVPVKFTAEDNPGKVSREITLLTDSGSGDELVITAYAQVVPDAAEPSNEDEDAATDEPADKKPVADAE